MKRIFTLVTLFAALLSLPLTAHAGEVVFDFENNNGNWPVGEGVNFADGNLTDPLVMGEVTLTGVQGEASQPVRIMRANDGISALYVYKNGAVQLDVAEGRAMTKVEVTMKSGSFDLTASSGEVGADVWTGNAQQVLFKHEATGNRQLLKLVITTAEANSETVKPAAAEYDVEVADIAALNALEDGTKVKLQLSNARVNGYNSISAANYVEDASGATVLKGLTLTAGQLLNGYVVGTKNTDTAIDFMNDPAEAVEHQLNVEGGADTFTAEATTLAGTVMSIAEATTQAAYGRLVTLRNVTISGGGQNKTLTDADGNTMKARDYMGVLPAGFAWPETAAKITGVVIYYMTGWFLMPVSAEAIQETAAETVLFDFANNNLGLPIGSNGEQSEAGNLAGQPITIGDVTFTFVNSPTMPTRYYNLARGNHLQLIAGAQLRITAAEGQAITAIRCTPNVTTNSATGATVTNVAWNTDKGEGTLSTDKLTWTGNATSVRFTATGATYLDAIEVETAAANGQTVTSPADEYVEVATIAEFNALANNTLARLQLTDAVVTALGANQWTIFVEDATAGAHMYCMPFTLDVNDVLNGYVFVKKSNQTAGSRIAMTEETSLDALNIGADGEAQPLSGTIAELNVAQNLNRLVLLQNVQLQGTAAATATATDGEGTSIVINNAASGMSPHAISYSFEDLSMAKANVVGILYGQSASENRIYPISITDATTDGIADAAIAQQATGVAVYNLQGQRQQLRRGINIVGGRKVVVK